MSQPYINSYYVNSANVSLDCPTLTQNITVDVCVVGAGSTGISTALHLAKQGYDVVVIEANKVGWGASSRSGGQALVDLAKGVGSATPYVGKEGVKTLFDMTLEALDIIKENCRQYNIDCDLKNGATTVATKRRHVDEIHETAELYAGFGYDVDIWNKQQTHAVIASDRYVGALYDAGGFAIHPLNYVLGLAQACQSLGVRIYENARMSHYQNTPEQGGNTYPFVAVCTQGTVRAKYGVFATNAYLKYDEIPAIVNRIMPVATYISATQPLGKQRALSLISNDSAVCDMNFMLDYYRFSKDYRLLFGGRASYALQSAHRIAPVIHKRMMQVFPQLHGVTIDKTWAGYVDITASRLPDFGWVDKNIVYAQGFSGHGIALTNLAGRIMAEAITGNTDRLDLVSRIKHIPFVGGRYLRVPILVMGMAWHRFLDMF